MQEIKIQVNEIEKIMQSNFFIRWKKRKELRRRVIILNGFVNEKMPKWCGI